ncbi:Dipeptidyl peptidase 9, partial [Danaus plexippus plexippus]
MELREAGDGAAGEYERPPKKYSWSEVRQAVHDLRKELSSLSTMVPMAISFRKLSNGKMRIYFLRTPQNGWEVTLLYTDVTPSQTASNMRLDWRPLIESNVALGVSSGKWSREEQLLWERQRVAAWGIASYELHPKTGRVLFPCASSLFIAEEAPNQSPPLVPKSLSTGWGAPLTPAMCPAMPSLVAHAARGDVWLAGDSLRRPARLTYACKGREERLSDDPKQAGVPCYVTQEEFSRYTGIWWQPQSTDNVFRIVYEEVDEGEVKIYSFPSSQSSSGEVEEFRFPRAGTPNAKSVLKMVTFRLQKAPPTTVLDYYQEGNSNTVASESPGNSSDPLEVVDVRWYELRHSLKEVFPWFEYLARVGWTPCSQYVWVQVLDRKQQRLELALVPVSEFNVPVRYEQGSDGGRLDEESPASGSRQGDRTQIQVLVSETAPDAWVNVHDILHFLPSEPGIVRFIWASEETGHLHLYLITCAVNGQRAMTVTDIMAEDESNAAVPRVISKEPLTDGDWEVMGRKIWVDEPRGLVYFVGLRETPLERHLYVVSMSAPRQVVLLTKPGHSHSVDMDESPEPRSFNGSWDCRPDEEESPSTRPPPVPPPQILSTRLSCGALAYCTLWRSAVPGRRPTVLHVYGGPEVQTVTNSYKGVRQLRMHMLAARGFTVVSVDSRGSKHRGRLWEAAIKGKMGQVELDDQ